MFKDSWTSPTQSDFGTHEFSHAQEQKYEMPFYHYDLLRRYYQITKNIPSGIIRAR